MWLLEHSGDAFGGRKLWLRPGKTYLIGRAGSVEPEPGQLAISDKTVSRKHLTIQVDCVSEGEGTNLQSRSRLSIEDLDTKKGTVLNGRQIRGQKHDLTADTNELKLGLFAKTFRITWYPVVLSFSFTAKEMQADPWAKLRYSLEQLDIKYSSEYEHMFTTHVVSKKRNTSKGLQALISGKYIVADSFVNTIVRAASTPEGAGPGASSALESDFEGNWPNALQHLPARGEEPTDRPDDSYMPDERRMEIFAGYTFIFYEQKQHENLLPVIASGKGKALLKEVVPFKTEVDDFVRYVKGVAGERGLGSFEDGSEGRGVVVVRYSPAKGPDLQWYRDFLNGFATRLDHRPIEQREFLEAILACDASKLRRPLQEAVDRPKCAVPAPTSAPPTALHAPHSGVEESDNMALDQSDSTLGHISGQAAQKKPPVAPATRRTRTRRALGSRFRGFDIDSDPPEEGSEVPGAVDNVAEEAGPVMASQDSLFVSQRPAPETIEPEQDASSARQARAKRPASPILERDEDSFMNGIAPTAAMVKRRRIEAGEEPVPAPPEPEPEEDEDMVSVSPPERGGKPQATHSRSKKGKDVKSEDQILELTRKRREEAEARAAAERRELQELPDDGIDYAAIRALHIIEECRVHLPAPTAENGGIARTREQDIAEGRWNPAWNGRKNFKRFRRQGDPAGRPPPRIIIGLEEVKNKEYGIGDDYWLEDGAGGSGSNGHKEHRPMTRSKQSGLSQADHTGQDQTTGTGRALARNGRGTTTLDSSDEESAVADVDSRVAQVDAESLVTGSQQQAGSSRTRAAKAAEVANARRSQTRSQVDTASTRSQTRAQTSKRIAAASPAQQKPAKRPRRGIEIQDSDESDDELKFRFGRRR